MSRLSLYLLGPPRIECDGLPVKVDTRKAIALLAYVAITRETHRRESLINLLWPESDQTRGRANLRRTLYALRQARIADWLDVDREGVCLKPGADVWLDVDQFHAFLAECRTHGHVASEVCPACVTPLTAAATLYRDDFLSGFSLRDSLNFDDWQFFQAEALRQKLAAVLERLVQALSAEGRFESASLCAKRWLALDRLNEAAHRQLMQLYAWSGQRTAALRQYQECVQVLQDQLGADPGESTTALHQAIIEKRVPRPPIDLARSPSREGQVEGILPRPEPRTEAVVSPPARPGDAMIGTLLGNRYRLEARLGRGSLGVVYRARDTLLEREVAVKVLSPRALDTEARARLFQEARAAAQLNHPNIVTVYDIGGIGEPDSPAFIVLEMVDGEALHHRRPQTLAETLSIVRQVCVALEQAHAHGIIHRDLKPENVLLTPDGTAKLMDFGLARTAASRITQEGFVVGTAYYLAPEQALGEELDGRADLYALGVMLYELTTGRLPFTGPNLQAIISQHLYAPVVPPRTHKPALPPALDALIVQLLSKRADERPASAVEVLRALERLEPPTPPVAVDRVAAPSPPPLDREREPPAVPGMDGSMSCTLRIRFLRIRLLGDFSLDFDDAPVSTINTPRLQSLLAYLLLHREAPQPRHHVAYTLWPDSTDAQARSNLRTLFYRLRDALPNADRFLQADAHTLQWRAEGPFTLDVAEFEGYAHPADSPLPVRERLERASAAYGGDLLPGCYDDWILPERERLRQMFYDVLERLILLSEDQRDYQGAIYHGQRLLRHDPLHEATYRRLMRLHALNGDRAGALRVYHTCATVLERELAVEPGPSTQEAYQRLLMREEAATSPPTTPDPLSPLVGRDQEWSRLQATWRRAAAGRASFALLSGEAGIGKTRLAEELVEWANRQGIVTASARCYATEGELAFGPIVAWMRARALPPLDDVWLTEVSRLLPELLAERPDLPTPGPLTQTWQRQRLFEALARGILGYKGPILLVIDDLQWCDRGTLEWLRFLLRFDPRARLLLVGTARSEELHDDHPLASLLLDLRRVDQLVEIELSTLDLTATRALAASVAGRELDLAHAEELHQEAEGNPLYVVEMVRSGLPGEDRVQSGALPAKVEAVIKARLNQLSPSARELVGVAATVGRAFTFDVLAQASGGDEETLVGALDQLWGRRIVREQGADAYDFSHHKIREVAYAELSLARRRLLHRQVAQALEKVYDSDLDAVSQQVATHYERSGMPGQAVPYFRRAAEVAERIYAHEETIDYLQRALRLHQALTFAESAKERHQEMAVQLHERLGDILHLTGGQDRALGAYRDALDNVWGQDWISRARLHRKLGNIWREKHQYHQALRAYETAETTLEEESARAKQEQLPLDYWQEWVQLQLERMWVYYWLDQWYEIANLEEEIRGTVEQFGTPAQHVNFLLSLTSLHLLRDRYVVSDVVISNTQAALAISQTSGSIGELAWVRFLLGFGQLWRGDLDKAEEQMLAALKGAETTGDIVHQSRCLTYLTVLYRKRGQVDCVQAYAARSLSMAEAAEMPEYVGTARANQAYVAWHLGDYAGSRAHGQAALASWHQLPTRHASCSFQWTALWPLVAIALTDGELSKAIEYARILLEPSQQRLPDPLARAVEQAIDDWENDQLDEVETHLGLAVSLAQESSYL